MDAVSIDNISQVMVVDLPVIFPAGGLAWLPSRMPEVASGCSTMAALRLVLTNGQASLSIVATFICCPVTLQT